MHVQFDALSKEHKVGAVKSRNYVSQRNNQWSILQRCLYLRFPRSKTGERDLSRCVGGEIYHDISYQETYYVCTNINHKGLQRTANEYAEELRIYKDLISRNNN